MDAKQLAYHIEGAQRNADNPGNVAILACDYVALVSLAAEASEAARLRLSKKQSKGNK